MAKILIIDDSAVIREQLQTLLTKGGYEVIEAEDGEDGAAKAKQAHDLCLIISDYAMPKCNGITMLEKIRTFEHHQNTPVFILTGECNPTLKAAGRVLKVTVWIVKPFDERYLLTTIEKTLARTHGSAAH